MYGNYESASLDASSPSCAVEHTPIPPSLAPSRKTSV